MFILIHKRKLAFVRIPRTGNMTIQELAKKEDGISVDNEVFGSHCPGSYRCVCFVRNPFSRIYSAFCRFARYRQPNRQAWRKQLNGYFEFIPFVKNRLATINDWHFYPMKHFLEYAPQRTEILRFENIAESMKNIIGYEVPHINKSSEFRLPFLYKADYREAYDEECIEIVSQLYKWDIDNLGYTF